MARCAVYRTAVRFISIVLRLGGIGLPFFILSSPKCPISVTPAFGSCM